MTPEQQAARDRVAAFLHHPGLRRGAMPGDPRDLVAVITGDLRMPRLYKSDLRLLVAAFDPDGQVEEPPGDVPHRITMRAAEDGHPYPHDVTHPPACDLLAYGQLCQFDYLTRDQGHAWPDQPGVWAAGIVLAREPDLAEEPEIHYERIGDA